MTAGVACKLVNDDVVSESNCFGDAQMLRIDNEQPISQSYARYELCKQILLARDYVIPFSPFFGCCDETAGDRVREAPEC